MRSKCSIGKYYRLESALQHKSSTLPFPFVIAHECCNKYVDEDGNEGIRTREYYAFDSVDHYLENKLKYPHAHEVIYARNGINEEGRLIFDFDIEDKLYKGDYVAPTFKKDVERAVRDTFKTYYKDVDIGKMRFVWL